MTADWLDQCGRLAEASPLPMALVTGPRHVIRYINPAFCRLVGEPKDGLLGTEFACSVFEESEFPRVLDRVRLTGEAEIHAGADQPVSGRVYASYVWPVRDANGETAGIMIHVTETTPFLLQTTAMNQALLVSSVRQHELTEAAEKREEDGLQERQRLTEQVLTTGKKLDRSKADLRALAASLVTAQEEERRRIARDLHDDFAQRLALIEINLTESTRNGSLGEADLSSVITQVSAVAEEIRKLSHGLHPSTIETLGLSTALDSLGEDWERTAGLPVRCTCPKPSHTIPRPVAIALYRIAQEALRNAKKHAGDARVSITLSETRQDLELTIQDDGRGFDARAARRKRGLGLIGMHERAALLGGRLRIRSSPGKGTTIRVAIPWRGGP